jgi:CheY-like chemotaxis protein
MKRILIVEDEIVLQDVYKLVLTKHGYQVFTANNGLEGLTKLKESQADLVLLDFFMPQMDGREFLRNFANDEYPTTKIIVYTNLSDNKTETEMLELGADRFVLKSNLTPKDLTDLVDGVLA